MLNAPQFISDNMNRSIAHFLAVLFCIASLVGCTKTDPTSVANYVRDDIKQQFPRANLEDLSDTELAVTHVDGNRQVVDLAPIQEGCRRIPRTCGRLVGQLLIVMQESLTKKDSAFKLTEVMPIISTPAFQKALVEQNQATKMRVDMIADGLAIRYAVATDNTLTFLDDDKLKALGIAPDVLLKTAFENVETNAVVNASPFPGETGVHQIFGHFASSGLLTKKHADLVRDQLKYKELAVAFPRRGMVLVADAENSASVMRLREISARFLQPPLAVISKEVYLITPKGINVIQHS
jgi:uncharacterized protein YtpQ (UPF0354 family)